MVTWRPVPACRVETDKRFWGLALVWLVVGLLLMTEAGASPVWVGVGAKVSGVGGTALCVRCTCP